MFRQQLDQWAYVCNFFTLTMLIIVWNIFLKLQDNLIFKSSHTSVNFPPNRQFQRQGGVHIILNIICRLQLQAPSEN